MHNDQKIAILETDKATIITIPKDDASYYGQTEPVSFADLTGALRDDSELKGKTSLEAEDFSHNLWTIKTQEEIDDIRTS